MNSFNNGLGAVYVALCLMLLGSPAHGAGDIASNAPALRAAEALSDDADGFARALEAQRFEFPRDHGPHPAFKNEWWYYTGNLIDDKGLEFGYQLTFFRIGLLPVAPDRASQWAANEIYMAHFALTDVANQQHYAFERFARSAVGLSGATLDPFRVWVEDWVAAGGNDAFPLQLRAAQSGVALDLRLQVAKPLVLQGEQGLSRKSALPGNASYYYSQTRLDTHGEIFFGDQKHNVRGSSWMDREWSTSALDADQQGWDWFALQLDDGRDVMYYRLRRKDGSVDAHSAGSVTDAKGNIRALRHSDVSLQPVRHWASPDGRVRYPVTWRVEIPSQQLDLTVEAKVDAQEMRLTVRYWEGAVKVSGTASGNGYLELVGYMD